MAKCSSCNTNYDNPADIELIRNSDNRWVPVCKNCLEKGVQVDSISPTAAVDKNILATIEQPSIDVSLVREHPLENIRSLLSSLRNIRKTAERSERVGRVRTHERKSVEITVSFSLARDDTPNDAVIRDLSKSGVKITTRRKLERGQIVQFDWNSRVPPHVAGMLQGAAEVRRVVKNDDGTFDAGLRFVKRQVAKGANRRRFRRYKCDIPIYYQREESEIMTLGLVKDISQGGCQLHLDESLDMGEIISVRLMGGAGVKGDLVGTLKVCRATTKDAIVEIGCAFVQMKMEKLGDESAGEAQSSQTAVAESPRT